jgi:tetratricopeptide (TPR) repeat protein
MAAGGVATFAFAVYALGACPTIYVGDSGELVTAVHVLGIPHPTGYPLYVLLGKLWTSTLPVGSVAWRMSLFSAAAAATACGLVYRLGRGAGLRPPACAAGALTLAFSPSFWSQANIQRVYALGALFVVVATALAFRWNERRQPRVVYLAMLVCGLGAANHTFMALYAIVLGAYACAAGPRQMLVPHRLAAMAGAFSLGLLPYLYLPLRSLQDPPLDWGNPETPGAFLAVVLRRDFWQRAWVETADDALAVLGDYLTSYATELTWVGAFVVIVGVWVASTRGWPVILLLAVMAANVVAVGLHGSRADIFIWHRYYIPSYVTASLLLAAGIDRVSAGLSSRTRWVVLALPAFLLVVGWRSYDRSRFEIAEAYSKAVLQSLPPGAHLAASDDNILFSLMYLTMVEGMRPDVDLILQGVGAAELPPLHFDPQQERLFFTHHPNWSLSELQVVPVGLTFEIRRAGDEVGEPVIPFESLAGERDPSVPKDHLTQNMIGDFHYMLAVTFEDRDWLRARGELELAAQSAPRNAVLFYNLGLLYRRNGLWNDAIAAFERSRQIDARPLSGRQRVRAADRLAEVAAEKERLQRIEAELAPPENEEDTAAHHRRLAELLQTAGERVAARGHRLRALEVESGS